MWMLYEYVSFTALATLRLIPEALRRHYDVVQIHNPPDFLVIAALLPRLLGSRVILDVHDLSSHMFRARFGGKIGKLIGRQLDVIERAAAKVADTVVTVHEPYRRELVAHGVPAEKVVVVMNVTDTALLASVDDRPDSAEAASAFVVAYCGTVAPWYGVELVVDAVRQLVAEVPEVRGLIIGAGDALGAIRGRALENGVADRIQFTGQLPTEEALRQLAGADCGVIPNLPTELNRFALSTKLFEYIALGLPVVVARLETLNSYFSDEEVTFFEPGDSRSLATALVWVAAHPAEAKAKAQRAQARVETEYSWSANRARYLDAVVGGVR
jgi:glycosyltransferase involved in cell wall biosynthesis